jgi:hypothetical protein
MKFLIFLLAATMFFNGCVQKKSNVNDGEYIEGEFYKQGRDYSLNLPYKISDDVEYVFDRNTPLAIDLIHIYVDKKKLEPIDKLLVMTHPQDYFTVHETDKGKNEYYISMHWLLLEYDKNKLIWDDGTVRFYQITRKMKTMEIKYRIILPFPDMSIRDLYLKDNEKLRFTEEYIVRVDLKNSVIRGK